MSKILYNYILYHFETAFYTTTEWLCEGAIYVDSGIIFYISTLRILQMSVYIATSLSNRYLYQNLASSHKSLCANLHTYVHNTWTPQPLLTLMHRILSVALKPQKYPFSKPNLYVCVTYWHGWIYVLLNRTVWSKVHWTFYLWKVCIGILQLLQSMSMLFMLVYKRKKLFFIF